MEQDKKIKNFIKTSLRDFLNESHNKIDDWEKVSIDDIKSQFPNDNFIDGGDVDDSYFKSKSIIIPNVDTAIEILLFLEKKMYPYSIGGNPNDIKTVWNKFPNSIVKLSLPMFRNERYNQIISFVFDNGEKYPPVFVYTSNHTESPYIWKRLSNASWKLYGKRDFEKFFR
jgi:hypothetical protein